MAKKKESFKEVVDKLWPLPNDCTPCRRIS